MPIDEEPPSPPSLQWRTASTATIALIGLACKSFLAIGTKKTDVHGLDGFIKVLEEREDAGKRERGLLTVSNHTSVLDDPLIWGFLPIRYFFSPDNMRWSLGSYDICFKNNPSGALATFFNLGQVLPTHRRTYSEDGGLFQPTVPQCIRLLSNGPFTTPTPSHPLWPASIQHGSSEHDISDPFSNPTHTYTTTGHDVFPAPSSYSTRRHSWVHIFPEGKVHQHPQHTMRYLKWGIARLILESEPCPQVVPIWISGPEEIMHEARPAPRWWPRWGKTVSVTFGEPVSQRVWDGFRERWKKLRDRELGQKALPQIGDGTLETESLMYSQEAVSLRLEVVAVVREEILKLRRARGWPDEDSKAGLADTYREEGVGQDGKMEDGSWIKDT